MNKLKLFILNEQNDLKKSFLNTFLKSLVFLCLLILCWLIVFVSSSFYINIKAFTFSHLVMMPLVVTYSLTHLFMNKRKTNIKNYLFNNFFLNFIVSIYLWILLGFSLLINLNKDESKLSIDFAKLFIYTFFTFLINSFIPFLLIRKIKILHFAILAVILYPILLIAALLIFPSISKNSPDSFNNIILDVLVPFYKLKFLSEILINKGQRLMLNSYYDNRVLLDLFSYTSLLFISYWCIKSYFTFVNEIKKTLTLS
ncbi:hypothetical protein [Mycoplasma crocodyli]|uniref:Putative membrane protein n=1 Tax=Mycoplasma crocodyli (strain ATCC 51981 / MP145) TaxID=512564 RepID=D5E6A2_MYCCM|nr:hypothetical protein [Mycoplasma crocodyli]ADE19583.1 putative membrane protein [Mycoplasma crocodyli MP145]